MSRIISYLFVFILMPFFGQSQRIFVTGERHMASFDVLYVQNRWQADVCVNIVSHRHQARRSPTRDGCDNWFFVHNRMDADFIVRVVNNAHPNRRTIRVFLNTQRGEVDPYINNRDWYDDGYYDYMYDRNVYGPDPRVNWVYPRPIFRPILIFPPIIIR